MKFDKEHKTIIKTLNILEAKEYLLFLIEEKGRHNETLIRCKAKVELWNSELQRQIEEMDKINKRIKEIKKRLGL